ncbi:MAG: PAC2 family protein [Planctomycetota bacterium]|jgi:proteasome assembly chaperone (PAC2) family protein
MEPLEYAMTEHTNHLDLRHPWLVAAWPGMGSVAAIGGSFLLESLGAEPVGMIPEREFFSVNHVDVEGGIARTGQLPRSLFFVWSDPARRHDLLIFLGEAQPEQHGFDLCQRIIEFAVAQGVERVVTFAAMASQIHPSADPRVFGAVTQPALLEQLADCDINVLQKGRVGGLNGALLAAASDRGVEAICLLGELPFYAAGVPNPKSSLAVLEAFASLAGLDPDLSKIRAAAEQAEGHILALFDQLRNQVNELRGQSGEDFEEIDDQQTLDVEEDEPALDAPSIRHIEELFDAAEYDHARADELKQELDRLGVFQEYEDRFLDLFRRAG